MWHKVISTLRGKLSIWYVGSVGLIIGLFLIAISVLFWFTLLDQIDHHVHIAVNEAAQIVQNYRGQERDELIKNLVSAQGMTVVVLSPDGAPLLETNSPDVALVTEHQLQKILTSSSLYDSAPVHFTENNIRFAAQPIQVNAGKGIAAVGYSTQVLNATFIKMLWVVAAILIFLVMPITFIGYKLLKIQLQPLEAIALQAKKVSDLSALSTRISIPSPTKELLDIQLALNSMLAQLEIVFKSEREFFSDAAHTLKTPLAVIRSQIESSNISPKAKEEFLTSIDATNETVQDLLFLSKIRPKPTIITKISLSDLMTDLVELATTLGENMNLKVSSDIQKNVTLKADKKLLQRALSNIVYNAVFYNRPNGSIEMQLKRSPKGIKIFVKDTGIGISKKDLPKVFARFYRGINTTAKGSGLGLAISKAVIDSLGGKISIKSVQGKGTTVTIVI